MILLTLNFDLYKVNCSPIFIRSPTKQSLIFLGGKPE